MSATQSENFIARRTESLDADKIAQLVTKHTEKVFGRINVESIIEHANLSITLVGVDGGEVLGHMALFDYPRLKEVEQSKWEQWLQENYECKKASPVNSLFVHLFVAKEGFVQGALAELLRATFMSVPLLQYVFMNTASGTKIGQALSSQMSAALTLSDYPTVDLYVSERCEHFPMLHIRQAVVEDADDLMPIFTQYSTEMQAEYGEFFLAELIESQDAHHKTIVADVGGNAVGFLSVTTKVDADLLNTCYQLESFHGFKSPVEEDEVCSTYTEDTDLDSTLTMLTTSTKSVADSKAGGGGGSGGGSEKAASPHLRAHHSATVAASTAAHHQDPTTPTGSGRQSQSTMQLQAPSMQLHAQSAQLHAQSTQQLHAQSAQLHAQSMGGGFSSVPAAPAKDELIQTSQKQLSAASLSTVSQHSAVEVDHLGTVINKQKSNVSELTVQSSIYSKSDLHMASEERVDDGAGADGAGKTAGNRVPKKQCVFKGKCNALAVQLFAIDDKYETRSIDLLPMVFNLFPDYDFLLISQPHSYPEFPLLSHFTRVPPRMRSSVSQELYVLHKCGLLHSFSVSHATAADVSEVTKLSSDLQESAAVVEDVRRYVEARRDPLAEGGAPLSALVAKCAGQVVGVAVMREEMHMQYIRSHYNIEDFIYYDYHLPTEHAHLHHFMLNPVFASYAKHFIKECLRLSHKSCLYYPLYPNSSVTTQSGRPHSIITALSHMVPIKARRQIKYHMPLISLNAPVKEVLQKRPSFALYHTNRKLTLEPKITVNSRVVVVGASDTSLAFLESLVFSPHLYFTNLTLVSPHSFYLPAPPPPPPPPPPPTLPDDPTDAASSSSCPLLPKFPMTSQSLCFTHESHSLLGLNTWVNIIKQKMVSINRPSQYLVLESSDTSSLIYYDYLVLCTGMQYQVPEDLCFGVPYPMPAGGNTTLPKNMFTINGEHDAALMLQWVKGRFDISAPGDFVIFGDNLDAYSILQAIIECRVPPYKILLARPTPSSCGDEELICSKKVVLERLDAGLKDTGAKVWNQLSLVGFVMGDEGKIAAVQLQSAGGDYEVQCQAFVYVDKKQVDKQAFKAMNDACLVFDRRLVISTAHITNDPLIYAAGPVTKFSRRYHADQWHHACYNSSEVGQRLAMTMLTKLDPTSESWMDPSFKLDQDLLPVYRSYKAVAAYLPGGYHFLHIFAPKPDGEDITIAKEEGIELSTDTKKNGYMFIHVNQYNHVDEVIALSTKPLEETSNYLCLYDIHEGYLNNMLERYKEGLIPDFYEFFRHPWACAIFHDRFTDFMEEVREQLEKTTVKDGQSLVEVVGNKIQENPDLNYRQHLSALFSDSSVKASVEKRLFKYLQYNAHHLPMYAKPDMI